MNFNKADWSMLSEQQQDVIKWVIEDSGSLELLARAGCGKTFTLMKVVDAIVRSKKGDIALMAYNKKIADELKSKLESAGYDWRSAQAGTVHSFGFSAWRKVAPKVTVDNDKLRNIIAEESLSKNGSFLVQNAPVINKLCSLAKQRAIGYLTRVDDITEWMNIWDHHDLENDITDDSDAGEIIRAAQRIYQISIKKCYEVIDFDDMIFAPLFFKAKFWTKDWVLVDESQDTNPARRALALAMLKPRTGRMIFVGDPAQAIYGFTGADSDSMELLKKATNAKTLPLNVTRRCPTLIVNEAKRFVPDFQAWESAKEGVVRTAEFETILSENLGAADAILCRNTGPLVKTAYSLLAKGIACQVEGRDIGIGLIKLATRWKVRTLDALLNKLQTYEERQTAKFCAKDQPEKIDRLRDQLDCLRIIIDQCTLNKQHSIDCLTTRINGMFGDVAPGERPRVLTLSTSHKSKGREWERVYILGRDKYMPSPYAKKDWAVEQENNLIYVSITRSLNELIYLNEAA